MRLDDRDQLYCSRYCGSRMNLNDLPDDTCPACGAPLPDTRHPARVYCSLACRDAYLNGLEAAARAEARAGRLCPVCGKSFDASRSDQRFCGRTCQRVAAYKRSRASVSYGETACAECGETFVARIRGQRFCSQDCYHRTRREGRERACLACGVTFIPRERVILHCSYRCAWVTRRTVTRGVTAKA